MCVTKKWKMTIEISAFKYIYFWFILFYLILFSVICSMTILFATAKNMNSHALIHSRTKSYSYGQRQGGQDKWGHVRKAHRRLAKRAAHSITSLLQSLETMFWRNMTASWINLLSVNWQCVYICLFIRPIRLEAYILLQPVTLV